MHLGDGPRPIWLYDTQIGARKGVMKSRVVVCAALAALVPVSVAAQNPGKASDRALAPFVACRQVADVRARALCYDAALDRLQNSVAGREVVIVDKQQANEDRKALFGFSASHRMPEPKAPRAAPKAPETIEQAIDSTIVSAHQSGYDRWTIRLATGAVWRTLEPGIVIAPKVGEDVHIRRGTLGSFMLRIGKGRSMRAMRVN